MHALEAYRFYDAKIKEKGGLSPEDPHEIVAVFGPDGRLKRATSDFDPHLSGIPELDGPGHVITHQHPGGKPPSFMDLAWLIEHNPTQINRTVALQKDGSMDLFEMRVNGKLTGEEIEAMRQAYRGVIRLLGDSFKARMMAIELTVEHSNGKLQFRHKQLP